jgi:Tfp pilus assembly protein PilF
MKTGCVLLFAAALAGCAGAPVAPRPDDLFQDALFTPPSVRISAADVFALSAEMRSYITHDIDDRLRIEGKQRGLFDALYDKNQLKLDYKAEATQNAAQTFAAKSGNCLSLVIMTSAFAKVIGLPVRYQKVLVKDAWSRSGEFYFSSAHVNLTLGRTDVGSRILDYDGAGMTIDFVGPEDILGRRVRSIKENTIVAMYMNNRAAEALADGQVSDAYWWAREAIVQDPGFLNSYNTLGVAYRRHGNLQQAEHALHHVLELEPENPQVMSNLIRVLSDEGQVAEANVLTAKLDQLQPYPPFYYFNLGQAAMRKGDFKLAQELFTREVDRDEYYHEFHFWLAAADVGLGDYDAARKELGLAMLNSTTPNDHALYAAKLDRIKASRPQ